MNSTLSAIFTTSILVFVFVVMCAFLLIWRYIRYKENVELIRSGLLRPDQVRVNGSNTLRWGVILTCVGTALSLGFTIIALTEPHESGTVVIGLVVLAFGVALLIIHRLSSHNKVSQGKGEGDQLRWED